MSKGDDYIKLTYFNARGRCEHIRYMFAAAGIVYEDKRIDFEEWKKLKPNSPLGFLPILQVGTHSFSQSMTCGRLAAKLAKLQGSTPIEQAQVDMVVETANELRESVYLAIKDAPDEQKAAAAENFLFNDKPEILMNLSKLVPDGLSPEKTYFVGGKLSWADVHFYACIEHILMMKPDLLDKKCPKLKNICKNVETRNYGIQQYRQKRPKTNI